jgi:hypothetical protein
MADPFDTGSRSGFDPQTARAKDDLNARFQDLRRDAAQTARTAAENLGDQHGHTNFHNDRAGASSIRDQASQAADEAKGAAASIAEQARARLNDIVDQQKAAGADKIAGVAKAAHSAADNLDETNPHMARLVRSAAENVDRIADDFRSRDIGDVLATVADFGRRQPVAFFGGAVLAGFLLSRFFKSDAPLVNDPSVFADRDV